MAYIINEDDCVNCAACSSECPVDAISEVEDAHRINADTCTSCGACAEVCPVECISEGQ